MNAPNAGSPMLTACAQMRHHKIVRWESLPMQRAVGVVSGSMAKSKQAHHTVFFGTYGGNVGTDLGSRVVSLPLVDQLRANLLPAHEQVDGPLDRDASHPKQNLSQRNSVLLAIQLASVLEELAQSGRHRPSKL